MFQGIPANSRDIPLYHIIFLLLEGSAAEEAGFKQAPKGLERLRSHKLGRAKKAYRIGGPGPLSLVALRGCQMYFHI